MELICPRKEHMDITAIAEVCHEVNRAYCLSLGDTSQPIWDTAPEWQKKSAINGVKYHLNNRLSTPQSSHESWLKEKSEQGWKFGTKKDAQKKEHPCFVPYLQLPEKERSKDFMFLAVVRSLEPHLVDSADAQDNPEKIHLEMFNDKDESGGIKAVSIDEFESMEIEGDKFWFSPQERADGKTYWKVVHPG